MRELLGSEEELQSFLLSYEKSAERGLRLNLRKLFSLSAENREKIYVKLTEEWGCSPLPEASWEEKDGKRYYRELYLDEARLAALGVRPGRHPYHEAGLYYMQEPSAMQAVRSLHITESDRVADLCASPGGKSGHAADFLSMEKGGILLSNEYVGSRARTLSSNIERLGILHSLVLNEDTSRLAERFPAYFSRVIIDAPCSGEGMFRKDENAVTEWSPENVERCIIRQREIVRNGLKLLAPGGRLGYSTCTFERGENEGIRDYLLSLDSSLSLVSEKRIFPHRERGEGHYIAVFAKAGESSREPGRVRLLERQEGERRSLFPDSLPEPAGLRTLRVGCFKSRTERKREEPEHGYSHTEPAMSEYPCISLSEEDRRVWDYLTGLEITAERAELGFPEEKIRETFQKGYVLVAVDGAALGFGRYVQGRIKNDYPKGLRFTS